MRKEVPVLDLNAFTAGVEPGGLTHGYEIKILVCYLLEQIGTGMTFTQISDALLHRSLVNYFELANALSDLAESGHLTCEDCAGRQEDTNLSSDRSWPANRHHLFRHAAGFCPRESGQIRQASAVAQEN